jgi:trehalose utilization protein
VDPFLVFTPASFRSSTDMPPLRVTIWNEFVHERTQPEVAKIYPNGIHGTLAEALRKHGIETVRTATLAEPDHGLTEEVLRDTDVLTWWGHAAHDDVRDDIIARVHARVLEGMGLIILHSGHWSKLFKRVLGTSCALCWREAGERERVWVVDPGHPIANGIDHCIELEQSEMYGEPFGIPTPDDLVFVSWFQGGEVFRGGCTWRRGSGRIFYFSPGHESYPIYHHPQIQRVIANGVRWAAPQGRPSDTPRNTPIEQARERIVARGPSVHDADGNLSH